VKKIFNSLGSNYDANFRLLSARGLFGILKDKSEELEKVIEKKFFGQVILTYKGRDAISVALEVLGIGVGDQVITQAFSCHAIEFAIERVGAEAVFVDLANSKVHPEVKELDKALMLAPRSKVLIIQHTLGLPARIETIHSWCKTHKIWLIEDLAQAVGGKMHDGRPLGSLADVVVLSFGRDKMTDAVSGGACIVKSNRVDPEKVKMARKKLITVPKLIIIRDLIYPWITWLVKSTDSLFIGKVLFRFFTLIGLIKSPVWSPLFQAASLPSSHTNLVLYQWRKLEASLIDRRLKAEMYQKYLSSISIHADEDITNGSNLRYSVMVENPQELIVWLKQHNVEISDRWYRSAVDSGRLHYKSNYQTGSCVRAEKLAKEIVNLPTHEQVSLTQVESLAKLIKEWKLKS